MMRFGKLKLQVVVVCGLLLFLSACGPSEAERHTEKVVHHELKLDLQEGDRHVFASWSQTLKRIQPETQVWAAFEIWNDTLTLYPFIRRLREVTPTPTVRVVQDKTAFEALPQSIRDSFSAWQTEGLLAARDTAVDDSKPVLEFELAFRNLLPAFPDGGTSSLVFLDQGLPNVRMMFAVHGDEGWTDAFVDRIDAFWTGRGGSNEVSTRISTDQFSHVSHNYPINFRHFVLDSLLDELEYGLLTLQRPARIRVATSYALDPVIVNELEYLTKALDLDLALVVRRDLIDHTSFAQKGMEARSVSAEIWIPEMVLLEGDFGRPAEGRPRKRQILLMASVPCLQPVEAGNPGVVIQVMHPPTFEEALEAWQRIWEAAQPLGHPVEFEDDNAQEDS